MKYFKSLILLLLTVWFVTGCGNSNKSTEQVQGSDSDSVSLADQASKDKTVYGVCGSGSAMNTLELITDNGDTLNISIMQARDNNMVFGGLEENDKMAVLLAPDKSATEVINLSTLLGNWVEPNPLDGSDVQGVQLKEGGIASSINISTQTYKTWRIFNGQLVLTSVSEGAGDEDEDVDTFNIKSLGSDSLCIANSNETHQFSRK
jgi:hypothetical protein